jgi:large subunit ribosomal protein L21
MKKAVIQSGNKQYIVYEGLSLDVFHLSEEKTAVFEPLMVIDGDSVSVGTPTVSGVKVTAEIVTPLLKADKVTAIRYKAKKRVKKVRGHRQQLTTIKITKIL